MNAIRFSRLVFFAASISASSPTVLFANPPVGYELDYAEEFDGSGLDLDKWAYRADAKHRSIQRAENISIGNGVLRLDLTPLDTPIQGMNNAGAGIVTTRRFHYGYYEVRARMGDGIDHNNDGDVDEGWHHAFWAMFADPDPNADPAGSITTTFPPERRTEIDCYENADGEGYNEFTQHIIIWQPNGSEFGRRPQPNGDHVAPRVTVDPSFDVNDWNTYAFEWTAAGVQFFVNGQKTVFGAYPFDHPSFEHDEINVWLTAIAANWCDPDPEQSMAEYDYFRYYKPAKNHAYGRPVTVSSELNSSFGWENAIDGIISYESRWLGNPSDNGNTLEVELKEATELRQAHIYSGFSDQAGTGINSYQFEGYQNGSWQPISGMIASGYDEFISIFNFDAPVTAERIRLLNHDTGFTRIRELALWSQPTSIYTDMSSVHLFLPPTEDTNSDGVANLIHHATVGMKKVYAPPVAQSETVNDGESTTVYPTVWHYRNLRADDSQVRALWSTDLNIWNDAVFMPALTETQNDGTAKWFWRAPEPLDQNDRLFFRLSVEKVD